MGRNHCSRSPGITAHDPPELVLTIRRNTQLKHPSGGQLITSLFTVADDKDEARKRALEEDVATAEFLSDTSGWTVLSEDIREIGEEHIEEAAIRVLGWHAPK